MTFLEILNKYNIPTNSYISAIQYISDEENKKGKLSKEEYQARINEICDTGKELEYGILAEYTYKYLIQETLRVTISNDVSINMYDLYNLALNKANKFIADNEYLWESKTDSETDSNNKVKPKRGSKKEATCKLWAERKDEGLSRQEWMKLLIEEVGCTKAGASTYYAKLKKGEFGC